MAKHTSTEVIVKKRVTGGMALTRSANVCAIGGCGSIGQGVESEQSKSDLFVYMGRYWNMVAPFFVEASLSRIGSLIDEIMKRLLMI